MFNETVVIDGVLQPRFTYVGDKQPFRRRIY